VPIEVLKEEELRKLEISLEEKRKELEGEEEGLKKKREDLAKKEKELLEIEKGLYEKEENLKKRFAEFEDREKALQGLATYFQNMPPDAAAKILLEMDDMLVIDILRRLKDETVAVIMMRMDPKKASEVSRKMSKG